MIPPEDGDGLVGYWDVLAQVIAKADERVDLDFWMGTLHVPLPDGRDLYATPGWEGESLPWCVQTDNYADVDAHGNIPVEWTGRLREDLATYQAALTALIAEVTA